MRKIRIGLADYTEEFEGPILDIISKHYEPEFCEDPDYVFCTCFYNYIVEAVGKRGVRIFFSGENCGPNFDMYDYCITPLPISYDDRYLCHPYCFDHNNYRETIERVRKKHIFSDLDLAGKNGFCSMVVSNSNYADPIREDFFHYLCEYKRVDSGGRHLNNIGQPDGVADKFEFTGKHKFALCFENSMCDGYVTEKITEAFAARTIPIYWGDKAVFDYFNRDAFIYVSGREDFERARKQIEQLDNDDAAYAKMLAQPAIINDSDKVVYERLEKFLLNIFEQPLEKAFRRSEQGWIAGNNAQIIVRNRVMKTFVKLSDIRRTLIFKPIWAVKRRLGIKPKSK